MKWLLWPVLLAVMSRIARCALHDVAFLARIDGRYHRIGRYLPYGVAVLARIGGRHEQYWPVHAVWSGCSGPYR